MQVFELLLAGQIFVHYVVRYGADVEHRCLPCGAGVFSGSHSCQCTQVLQHMYPLYISAPPPLLSEIPVGLCGFTHIPITNLPASLLLIFVHSIFSPFLNHISTLLRANHKACRIVQVCASVAGSCTLLVVVNYVQVNKPNIPALALLKKARLCVMLIFALLFGAWRRAATIGQRWK